ncbi:MAG: DUF3343 domain-containing protein [Alkaliphilus sp.]
MKKLFYVVTFYSVSLALQFEKLSKEKELAIELIPVPRQISSSCGLAAKFSKEVLNEILALIKDYDFEYDSVYLIDRESDKSEPLIFSL